MSKISRAASDQPSTSNSKTRKWLLDIVKTGDLDNVIAAYLQFADFTIKDERGCNLLHIAVENEHRTLVRGLIALTITDCLWEQKNIEGKRPVDIATTKIKKDLQLMSIKCWNPTDHHTILNRQFMEERLSNPNPNHKVLLSCDGGGIKAVLELGMMLAIERELGEPLLGRVHWLAGTSCGGILSCTLGAGINPDQARRIFLAARNKTFPGNNKMYPKHDSKGIETVLRTALGKATTMGDLKTHKVLVTAAKVKSAPPSLVLFRSYAPRISAREYEKHGYLNPDRVLVWKAARSTSSAPVYFETFHGLADGAIFCNNPCITLITDFLRLKKFENHKGIVNNDEIGCVITIGSGIEPVVPLGGIDINLNSKMALGDYKDVWGKGKNLVTLFMYQCTASHGVPVGQAREWAHSMKVPYFRFSPKLSRAFELDNVAMEEIFDFMFESEIYLRTQVKQDIQDLARLLKSMPKNAIQDFKNTVRHS